MQIYQENFSKATATLLECEILSKWLNDKNLLHKSQMDLKIIGHCFEKPGASPRPYKIQSQWIYLKKHQLILRMDSKIFKCLKDSPLIERSIDLLLRENLSAEKFFEVLWELPYDPHRHSSHVRQTLSKIRKVLPKGVLTTKEGQICLS